MLKIIIIHGDDSVKSYERLRRFIDVAKSRNWKTVFLDESNISLSEEISAQSLFPEERFFIHRNFKKMNLNDISWIRKNFEKLNGNLVIYSDSSLTKTQINKFSNDLKIEEFKLPVLLWNFLDSIYPGNVKMVLSTFHKILEKDPPEFVFFLISNHFRDIFWAKTDPATMPYPNWRVAKLKSQASKYVDGILESFIDDLAKADIRSKTSNETLKDLLDFIFVTKLK